MSTFLSEFIGTMVLIILGNGVVGGVILNKSKANDSGWIVITIGWGLAVSMGVYAASISGAHLNPAVTLGLAAEGSFEWSKVPFYILAQFCGAMGGATLVWLHYLPHWRQTASEGDKLAVFATAPAIRSKWANLLSEIIGTFVLVAGVLFIGANEFTEGLNPLVVGGLVVAIGLSLGGTTGYAINPARDLGPRIMHYLLPVSGKGDSDWSYSYIPVIGPVIGGFFGANFYLAAFKGSISLYFWLICAIVLFVIIMAVSEENKKDKD